MPRRLRAYARRAHTYAIERRRDVGEVYLWNSHAVTSPRVPVALFLYTRRI